MSNLVKRLREFAEMPLEGGAIDPLIEVMHAQAAEAADAIEELIRTAKQTADYLDLSGSGKRYASKGLRQIVAKYGSATTADRSVT